MSLGRDFKKKGEKKLKHVKQKDIWGEKKDQESHSTVISEEVSSDS